MTSSICCQVIQGTTGIDGATGVQGVTGPQGVGAPTQIIGTRTATLDGVEVFTTTPDGSYLTGNDELQVFINGKFIDPAEVTELSYNSDVV